MNEMSVDTRDSDDFDRDESDGYDPRELVIETTLANHLLAIEEARATISLQFPLPPRLFRDDCPRCHSTGYVASRVPFHGDPGLCFDCAGTCKAEKLVGKIARLKVESVRELHLYRAKYRLTRELIKLLELFGASSRLIDEKREDLVGIEKMGSSLARHLGVKK